MDIIKYELEVPKECKEVIDALEQIAQHFMEKKPIAEIGALLPGMMVAFEGYDKLKEEISSEYRDELLGYLTHKLGAMFLPKLEAPVDAASEV